MTRSDPTSRHPDRVAASPLPFWRWLGVRVYRLGLILVLIWAGWSTWRSIRVLLRPSTGPALMRADARPDGTLFASKRTEAIEPRFLIDDGYWTFAGSPWEVGQAVLDPSLTASEFVSQIATVTTDPTVSSPELKRLIRALRALKCRVESRGSQHCYTLPADPGTLLFVTREEGDQVALLAAAVGMPIENGKQRVYGLRPRADRSSPAKSASLLPLPAGSFRALARRSLAGELQLEFVVLADPGQVDGLRALWTAADWSVEAGQADSGTAGSFRCTRGREHVFAWLAPTRPGSSPALILARGQRSMVD